MTQLDAGATLPALQLKLGESDTLALPADIKSDYAIVLFYRGYWWPFCRRLLDGYEKILPELKALGASVFAASSDPLDKAQEVAETLSFPIAWGVDRATGDALGSFWDEKRDFIQPSEFIVNTKGRVLSSTYSSSPVGRVDPDEALVLVKMLAARRKS